MYLAVYLVALKCLAPSMLLAGVFIIIVDVIRPIIIFHSFTHLFSNLHTFLVISSALEAQGFGAKSRLY